MIFEIFRFRFDNFDFAQNVLDKLPDKMRRGVVVLRRCGGLVVSVPASRHAGPVFESRSGMGSPHSAVWGAADRTKYCTNNVKILSLSGLQKNKKIKITQLKVQYSKSKKKIIWYFRKLKITCPWSHWLRWHRVCEVVDYVDTCWNSCWLFRH